MTRVTETDGVNCTTYPNKHLFLAGALAATSTVYYVDPVSGSDTSDASGTEASPFRTVDYVRVAP
jgi:hypothetical protein